MIAFDPPRLTVFCGSRPGKRPEYAAAARALGQSLVRHELGLVYGGGSVGLMGIVADAVLAGGGTVHGIIPQALAIPEVAHDGLSKLEVVEGMHPRKMRMNELCGGFIAMPGGIGTFEELFEVLSWAALRIHTKPVGLLDVAGYWAPALTMLDAAVEEGFLDRRHRELVVSAEEPEALLERLAASRRDEAPDPEAVEP